MDMASLIRTMGGLGVVLGVLAAALWVVRRYDLRLPGRAVGIHDRRLELVETLSIDARRTVALIRRDGREHVILIAPEGHLILETGVVREPAELAAEESRRVARAEAQAQRAWQQELRATAAKATIEQHLAAGVRMFGNAIRRAKTAVTSTVGTASHSEPVPARSAAQATTLAYTRPTSKRARRRRQIRETRVA